MTQITNSTNPKDTNDSPDSGFYLSQEEREEIEKKLVAISDFQRLSSLILWLALAMVILHIGADIFFHVLN